jgi:hypothetical protein
MKRSRGRLDTDEPLGKIDLARRDLLVSRPRLDELAMLCGKSDAGLSFASEPKPYHHRQVI